MEKRLFDVIDFILNRATEKELIAVRAALDRRKKGRLSTGKSLSDMVTSSTEKIKEQVQIPLEQIRSSVRDMVIRIIKQNAPEINDTQLKALLDEWVPKKKTRSARNQYNIPPDVLITMIKQFIAFSTGRMPGEQEILLRKEMQDWPEKYWNSFPEPIQILISSFLKAQMDEEDFWKEIYTRLE